MFDQSRGSNPDAAAPLARFAFGLAAQRDIVSWLGHQQIGKGIEIAGRFGPVRLVYADYVASGRALRCVEDFVTDEVLPFYANTHTGDSFCGARMTGLRENARSAILAACGGNRAEHAAIFIGSGATAALNRLVHLFGLRAALARGEAVHVLVGPYEHHSNLLSWRESGAEVIEIDESAEGGPDQAHLARVLAETAGKGLVIAAFSAMSNVTGITSDVAAITRMVKDAGALMVWDYAGGAPYLPVDLGTGMDAIALSPHKFPGGPGASGVLLVRRDAVVSSVPGLPGGGTVAFVNRHRHDYLTGIEEREEGGTPNIIGDIRAGLVFVVKSALGQAFITRRNRDLADKARMAWRGHPNIRLLADGRGDQVPVLSFWVADGSGGAVDYHLFTRGLSDLYGIQARGGCACAGPYVHRLLGIGDAASAALRTRILAGDEADKPGFVRLNLSVLMDDSEADFILASVAELAGNPGRLAAIYADDLQQG
ncbi:MAG: aminotransferase class V-fold PLP-dependent enzyme [Rhodobacteraceae bacterium]|nr:aminotransferase class V-fold PLP-dependent enzyme [Paracoccaceae bacterium]